MNVLRYGSLAGALLLAASVGAPVRAQDREPLFRTLDVVGRSARIGVSVGEVDGADAKQPKSGVVVETVTPDGPADKAGVKAGDAITEFDGERVRSVLQFSRLVQESTPGRSLSMTLMRGGQRVTVNVTPERRSRGDDLRIFDLPRPSRAPAPPATPRAVRPFGPDMRLDVPGLTRLWNTRGIGVTIESLDDQLAQYFGVKDGVLVKSVVEDSPAQKAGLKAGDVITAINGSRIYDTSDVNRAIDRVEENGEFTIDITRDRKTQQLKGKLDPGQARRRARTRTIL